MFVDKLFYELHVDKLQLGRSRSRKRLDLTLTHLFAHGHHTLKFTIHNVAQRVRETYTDGGLSSSYPQG